MGLFGDLFKNFGRRAGSGRSYTDPVTGHRFGEGDMILTDAGLVTPEEYRRQQARDRAAGSSETQRRRDETSATYAVAVARQEAREARRLRIEAAEARRDKRAFDIEMARRGTPGAKIAGRGGSSFGLVTAQEAAPVLAIDSALLAGAVKRLSGDTDTGGAMTMGMGRRRAFMVLLAVLALGVLIMMMRGAK